MVSVTSNGTHPRHLCPRAVISDHHGSHLPIAYGSHATPQSTFHVGAVFAEVHNHSSLWKGCCGRTKRHLTLERFLFFATGPFSAGIFCVLDATVQRYFSRSLYHRVPSCAESTSTAKTRRPDPTPGDRGHSHPVRPDAKDVENVVKPVAANNER